MTRALKFDRRLYQGSAEILPLVLIEQCSPLNSLVLRYGCAGAVAVRGAVDNCGMRTDRWAVPVGH
jgi:hypothetical protein